MEENVDKVSYLFIKIMRKGEMLGVKKSGNSILRKYLATNISTATVWVVRLGQKLQ